MKTPEHKKLNEQIYAEASDWLVEFRSGDVQAAGRKEFYDWLRTSPEHMRAYLELAAIWNEGSGLDSQHQFDDDALLAAVRMDTNIVPLGSPHSQSVSQPVATTAKPASRTRLLALAASVVFAVVAAVGWYWYDTRIRNVYTTGTGEQHRITLSDGSIVELNAQSKIRVVYAGRRRNVELISGQALFQVAHDTARPFIVSTDRTDIRAVGTQFDVYRRVTGTTVTVLEGTVALLPAGERPGAGGGSLKASRDFDAGAEPAAGAKKTPANPSIPVARGRTWANGELSNTEAVQGGPGMRAPGELLLTAGQQATVTAQAAVRQPEPDIAAATAWTEGHLVFKGTPLQEVADEFNRYNTRQLVIRDPELATLKVTGIFSNADPSPLIRFLEARSDIVVTETDHEILVSRSRPRSSR